MRNIRILFLVGFLFLMGKSENTFCQFKLTLQLHGMNPHAGQMFQVRVIDKSNSEEVGRSTVPSIPSADFDVELLVLLEGHSYFIDFYADHNNNKQYDSPPTDHAWRLEYDNAQGHANVDFTHNTNFTDISWPPMSDITEFAGTWIGSWKNITYQTTAQIIVTIEVITDSLKFRITAVTSGIFGFPDTITQVYEGFYSPDADTAQITPPLPWIGGVKVTQGEISGSVTAPDFGGITLGLTGNFGPSQVIVVYIMSGAFQANGIVVATKQEGTKVIERIPIGPSDNFTIYQNFPNPFNSFTTISYNLPVASSVNITIFNHSGQMIEILANTIQNADLHSIEWNASDHSSGLYFFRIQAGGFTGIKKCIFLK
jgi:hypothetical protein